MMKHCSSLVSSAQCLLAALTPATARPLQRILFQRPPRTRSVTIYRGNSRANGRGPAAATIYDRLSEFTKDEQIQNRMVRTRGSDVEGGHATLSPPQDLAGLLQSLDREKQCVVQLSKPGTTEYPIVEIVDKNELRSRVRDKEKHIKQQQKESRERKPKQIEMSWAIDGHDLGIKLNQLETFLEKGKKVEILLAAKRRGRKTELVEGVDLLKQIRTRLAELDAKEIKPMEGGILKQATMMVQKNVATG